MGGGVRAVLKYLDHPIGGAPKVLWMPVGLWCFSVPVNTDKGWTERSCGPEVCWGPQNLYHCHRAVPLWSSPMWASSFETLWISLLRRMCADSWSDVLPLLILSRFQIPLSVCLFFWQWEAWQVPGEGNIENPDAYKWHKKLVAQNHHYKRLSLLRAWSHWPGALVHHSLLRAGQREPN